MKAEVAFCAIKNPIKYKQIDIGYNCAAAKGFFVIDPSGNIRTCNHSPHIVGHILKDAIIEDMDYWNIFAQNKYKPSMCSGCKMLFRCDCGYQEVANILYDDTNTVDSSFIPDRKCSDF